MYKFVLKDDRYRKLFYTYEFRNMIYKYFIGSKHVKEFDKVWLYFKYNKKIKNNERGSISYISSRCLLTYRSRFVFRRYRMTRHCLKHYGSFGLLCGVRKREGF